MNGLVPIDVLDYVTRADRASLDAVLYPLERWQRDPVAYVHERLGIPFLWDKTAEILQALTEPPYKVGVQAGHSVGKTFLGAAATNWWFDVFDPSVAITTAPTERDVIDLLWTEVRLQRGRMGLDGGLSPKAPEMRTSPDHYAKGFTARKGESFQGRHRERMLFVFDEAVGVDAAYWTTAKTMFKPEHGHAWLAIFNPTDTTSPAYQEVTERNGWRVFVLDAMQHPNIAAGLAGKPLPVPNAVSVSQISQWVNDWCEPIHESERLATDIQWLDPENPGQWRWFRPGPIFEPRCKGVWPSAGTYGVWSDALWLAATEASSPEAAAKRVVVPLDAVPEIGCDVARHGDDYTAFHVRWGNTSFHHEAWNGWPTTRTCGRLIELAREYAELCNRIRGKLKMKQVTDKDIAIKVDDTGVGGGVTDMLIEQAFKVAAINSQSKARQQLRYRAKRDELWFYTAELARKGWCWLGRLDRKTRWRLKEEAMAPIWDQDRAGRRVVEDKDDTKKKLGRSPDNMDALNLAYHDAWLWEAPTVLEAPSGNRRAEPTLHGRAKERGLFGR